MQYSANEIYRSFLRSYILHKDITYRFVGDNKINYDGLTCVRFLDDRRGCQKCLELEEILFAFVCPFKLGRLL